MAKSIYFLITGESLKNWCKSNSVPYETAMSYIRKGLLVDDACKYAKEAHERKLNTPTLMLNGKTLFSSLPKHTYVAIRQRIRKNGGTIEEALKAYTYNVLTGEKGRNRPVIDITTGKQYKSVKACADAKGLEAAHLSKLIKLGKIDVKYVKR